MIYKQIYFGHKTEPIKIELTQNSNGQTLIFESMDWEIPSTASCNIFVNKPDGHLIYNEGAINGNQMTFPVTTQMTAVPGAANAQVQIVTADEKILNSFVLVLLIEETIIDGTAVESTDEFGVLEGLITDAQTAITGANEAAEEALDAAGQAREPVQVGARNLVLNTLNPSSTNKPKLKGATDAALNNITASYSADGLTLNATGSNARYVFCAPSLTDLYCFEKSTQYYFRCKYSGSGTFSASFQESNPAGTGWEIVEVEQGTAATAEQELVMSFDCASYAAGAFVDLSLTSGASIKFTEIQLEKATVPSQYRPATEDVTVPLLAAAAQLNNLVIAETITVTTTSNWYVIEDSRHTGYALAACYRVNDGSSGYINGIQRRSTGGYTLVFEGMSSATQVSLYCIWVKK